MNEKFRIMKENVKMYGKAFMTGLKPSRKVLSNLDFETKKEFKFAKAGRFISRIVIPCALGAFVAGVVIKGNFGRFKIRKKSGWTTTYNSLVDDFWWTEYDIPAKLMKK